MIRLKPCKDDEYLCGDALQARADKLKHSDGALIDVFVEEGVSPATDDQLDALDEDGEVAMDTA